MRFSLQSLLALGLSMLSTVASAAPDGLTYFHVDNVGSPIAATDAYGNVTWRENYLPHGEKRAFDLSGGNNQQWFAGHFHDDDTKLTYMGARHYDPVLGRFLSVDPADLNPKDPFTFNRYAYANNNPYRYVDPDGGVVAIPAVVVIGVVVIVGTAAVCESCRQGMIDAFGPVFSSALEGFGRLLSGQHGAPSSPLVGSDLTGAATPPGPDDDKNGRGPNDAAAIVLGLRAFGLEETAAQVGGRTLLNDPSWKQTFLQAVRNPNARFTVSVEGLSGSTTYSRVMSAVNQGLRADASPTNWELAQLYQAERLKEVTFVNRAGRVLENPFR